MPAKAADGAPAIRLPGEVHARYEMLLSFRVRGRLISREAHLGQTVKRGQVLAQLDVADATSNRAAAEASLRGAEHHLEYAARQRDRDEAQAQADLISEQQLQQTRDAYASALAARDQAREQLALAKNQSGYTRLLADRDGVITSEQAEVGQVLDIGQAVFGFAWSGDRDVWANVPEDRITQISAGQVATVTLPSLPGRTFAAKVREVSPAADVQSRTYRMKLALDAEAAVLPLGMTAEAALSAGMPVHGVELPTTALFHQGERAAVWVVRKNDSTLELRPVTVLRYGERNVLVDSGLQPGEMVLMQGVHAVNAGEKVQPVAPPQQPEGKS
jgi:RND family efflux transporter MFP subunit